MAKIIRSEALLSELMKDGSTEYGEQIVSTLSAKLVLDYGQGFGLRSLRRRVQFAKAFSEEIIVATLSRELSWRHSRAGENPTPGPQ